MEHSSCLENGSDVTEFLILGFHLSPAVKPALFLLLLVIYILTVTGNLLIVATVSLSRQLHTPMYFFLVMLSLVEIFYTTSIAPTMLGSLLMRRMSVSLASCIAQFYMVAFLACNECFVLTLMAYDRYIAICYPLHYTTIMSWSLCIELASGAWVMSVVYSLGAALSMSTLTFSDQNTIDHFFCDFAPLLKTACSDVSLPETEVYVTALIVTSLPCILIVVSYVRIIYAILRIPSATGRLRAFSTCSSHLTVVITYFGTLIIIYGIPKTGYSLNLNMAVSVVYTVATPLLNPIIYTLRNKDIRDALEKCMRKICG